MPEPATLTALAIAGLSWTVEAAGTAAVAGTAGNISDRAFRSLVGTIRDRVMGLHVTSDGDVLARAVRAAQLQALERLIRDFRDAPRAGWVADPAVTAYHSALEEGTRERLPLGWATTQTNLGNALTRLGERESGTERLEQAVAAYRAALGERTRERVPLDWAITQTNLGSALASLGERESGTEGLEQAVAAYRAALEEFETAGTPYYRELVQTVLASTKELLAERRRQRLDEGV